MFETLVRIILELLNVLEGTGPWRYYISAALIFLLFLLARGIFARFVFGTILKLCRRTNTQIDTKILLAFQNPLKTLILIVGIYLSLLTLPLAERYYLLLYPIYRSLFIFLVAWGLYNLTGSNTFSEFSEKYSVDPILVDFFTKVLRALVLVLAAIMIVQTWGYNVEGFLAGLGLGGLAFALAAKDTVSNIFGGGLDRNPQRGRNGGRNDFSQHQGKNFCPRPYNHPQFTCTTKWSEYLQVREDIHFRILEILEREGVSVAFPSRSIYFENAPAQGRL